MTEQNGPNVMKIKGKLMYPKVFVPENPFGTERWTVDLLLDKEGLKQAQEAGLRIKKMRKKDGKEIPLYDTKELGFEGYDGSYLQIERPVLGRGGEKREPPIVKDGKLRDIDQDTKIGNGSDAYARFIVKTRDMQGKEMSPSEAMSKWNGYGMFLTGIQIVNLLEYEGGYDPDTDFVEEEGYSGDDGGFDFQKGDDVPFN